MRKTWVNSKFIKNKTRRSINLIQFHMVKDFEHATRSRRLIFLLLLIKLGYCEIKLAVTIKAPSLLIN